MQFSLVTLLIKNLSPLKRKPIALLFVALVRDA